MKKYILVFKRFGEEIQVRFSTVEQVNKHMDAVGINEANLFDLEGNFITKIKRRK